MAHAQKARWWSLSIAPQGKLRGRRASVLPSRPMTCASTTMRAVPPTNLCYLCLDVNASHEIDATRWA